MTRFGTSQPVKRVEDPRLLTGRGGYVDDLAPKGAAHAVFLRAPVARATITALEVEEAKAAPGVHAVITGAQMEAGCENGVDASTVANRDGTSGAAPTRPALAAERVRYVGEAVALILAESVEAARDAAELIVFEWEELPANADPAAAADAPQIHEEAPGNQAYDWAFGDEAATAAASVTRAISILKTRSSIGFCPGIFYPFQSFAIGRAGCIRTSRVVTVFRYV